MEWGAKRRPACGNDGTGASSADASTEGQEVATSSGYDHEVFLSFRGPDTRAGFTNFLYTRMIDMGIRAYKDDEDLRKGEEFGPELLQAIEQSKISMPIFSKGYASSVWCLKELVKMVECQKTKGQKIMPIFYDVAPSEVRHQTGDYAEAFRSHEEKQRYKGDIIHEWKSALSAVGAITGWDLHSKTDRQEGEFAKEVTKEVFRELKKAYLSVSDYLVSVDNHVDAIMEKIDAQTSETRIIGIHGMGGIGKTTIAKIIYNQLSNDFDHCCFLANIRETSKLKGIQCLQHQLISDILNTKWIDIRNVEEGIKTIKDRLSNKRVLLLFDDVNEKDHTDALVGERDWFGKGSKLIITTRNKRVLDVLKVDDCYELTGMDHNQSLQLFSKHAFRRDYPLGEYIDISKKVIDIAGGLPLALEVIGSLLSSIEKKRWDIILKKLENVPHVKVQSKLKISYEELDFRQKRIFLDIACFFIGYDKDILVYFWHEPNFYPEEDMEVLQNMSLIKIMEFNKVWMHDQVKDLGREIVHEESNMKIEKQSRVWDPKEALNLLRRYKGEKEVEGLHLQFDPERQYHFTYEVFMGLSKLRFLEVDSSRGNCCAEGRLLWHESPSNVLPTNVFQENSDLLPRLQWLSWHNIPPTFKITNFSMENVVILDLSESKITHDWKGWSYMEVMENLKVLDMSYCEGLQRTPNFSTLSNLERLILKYCRSLIEIDRSICRLTCLVSLDVSYCRSLQRLPDELGGGLASLEYLSLEDCPSLEMLPDSIGGLKSLIKLDISSTSIKELPDSIRNLKKLEEVKMWNSRLSKIPDVLWSMGNLKNIVATRGNNGFDDGLFCVQIGNDGICGSQSLRILMLNGADIYELPRLHESLINLKLSILHMDTFPDFSNLTNLKEMDLDFGLSHYDVISNGLGEHPMPQWIENLSKLEVLALCSHHMTTIPTDLSFPPQLKSLRLKCPNLCRLPKLPSNLSSLELKDCESLCSMEDLSNLKKLSSLRIRSAAIAEIQGLGCLENLRELVLHWLGQVEILPNLSNLNKLTSLQVGYCDKLVEIQGQLPRFLQFFRVDDCGSLQKLPNLSSLMGKQAFVLYNCKKLNVEAILDVAWLNPRHFQLVNFEQLQILPNLSNSNELRCLQVEQCHNLVEIQGKLPQSLEVFEINSCKSLRKLPNLSTGLREVRIGYCNDLVEIQGELPQSLEKVLISHCVSLQKLPYLSRSIGLQKVCIRNCDNLVEIQGELPQPLEVLEINSCKSLQKLPNLSSSTRLREVHIGCCNYLVEIQGELPQSLEKVAIIHCVSLQKLPYLSSSIGLREVCIGNCDNLVEIQGELPQSLEVLKIDSCKSLRKLPNLPSSMGLRQVHISWCNDLVEIQGELPQHLEVSESNSYKSLQKLPNLPSFMWPRQLCIEYCNDLVEIQGKLPQSLEVLEISSCESLHKLSNLSSSMGLRQVRIDCCHDLVEIPGELPQSLEVLKINSCESLQKLPNLSSSTGLRKVHIGDCHDLVEIQGELPQSLKVLAIHKCQSLRKLPNLSSSTGLQKVHIGKCHDLVEIQGELPQSLKVLAIYKCQSLHELPNLSSLKGLRKVIIFRCRKLNVEAISSLCSEMSVKFVKGGYEYDSEEDVEVDDEYDFEEDVEVDDELKRTNKCTLHPPVRFGSWF